MRATAHDLVVSVSQTGHPTEAGRLTALGLQLGFLVQAGQGLNEQTGPALRLVRDDQDVEPLVDLIAKLLVLADAAGVVTGDSNFEATLRTVTEKARGYVEEAQRSGVLPAGETPAET